MDDVYSKIWFPRQNLKAYNIRVSLNLAKTCFKKKEELLHFKIGYSNVGAKTVGMFQWLNLDSTQIWQTLYR